MGAVTMSGRLPGEEGNGLLPFEDVLLHEGGPAEPLVVVALVDQDKWSIKKSTDEPSAIVRLVRLEVVSDEAERKRLLGVLAARYEQRTGNVPLPDVSGGADQ